MAALPLGAESALVLGNRFSLCLGPLYSPYLALSIGLCFGFQRSSTDECFVYNVDKSGPNCFLGSLLVFALASVSVREGGGDPVTWPAKTLAIWPPSSLPTCRVQFGVVCPRL